MKEARNRQEVDNAASGIWRYGKYLPKVNKDQRVTMGEGHTPIVRSRRLVKEFGLSSLYFKLESANPTGSYKDRISAMATSLVLAKGKAGCIGTSSGNAGASTAAYSARAGIPYYLYVQENILPEKMVQAAIHKATITRVEGLGFSAEIGTRVFEWIQEQAVKRNLEPVITAYHFNPEAMDAVKTIAFELTEQLQMHQATQDVAVFVPTGGGGLYSGIRNGFNELHQLGMFPAMPRMVAVQSEGCANIVRAWMNGEHNPAPGDSASRISGLQVPNPPDGKRVLESLHAGEGFGVAVSDDEVWHWQEKLASEEGIWCEPAAAASVAGVAQAVREGRLEADCGAVCIISGAGFKDGARAAAIASSQGQIPLMSINHMGK